MKHIGKRSRSKGPGAKASSASNLKPNYLRLIRWVHAPNVDFLLGVIGLGISAILILWGNALGQWITGGVIVLALVLLVIVVFDDLDGHLIRFSHGSLTAGIVESVSKNEIRIITITSISQGQVSPSPAYGIRKKEFHGFPKPIPEVGERIALGSGFGTHDKSIPYWTRYDSIPIAFGTGRKKAIKRCLEVILEDPDDDQPFDILTRYLKNNEVPELDTLYICDENGNPLDKEEVFSRKRVRPISHPASKGGE